MRPTKYCPKCGGTYGLGFFRRNKVLHAHSTGGRHPICKGCEQTRRDREKAADRWLQKARDTRRRHAPRLGRSIQELEHQFAWQLDQMAHDAAHAYENQCPGCRKPFLTMGHGLGDITLDITDPTRDPFYVTNARWICQTCNRQKSKTPPDEWAELLIGWARWEQQQIIGPLQRTLF